nr:methyl-accepting chemotaxis protein [uncultured Caproiciproducens sp.]
MKHKKGLLSKMLLLIGVPVAIIFCITALIVLNNVKQSVSQLTTSQLTAESQAASYQIGDYFSKYTEIATQMAANSQFEKTFIKAVPGTSLTATEGFTDVKRTLDNIKQTDPDNIVVSWIADVDSSQLTQSDGYSSDKDWNILERPWYKELLQKQTVFITEPYQDTATKALIVSVVAPVYQSSTKTLLGVTAIDFNLDHLYSMVQNYKLGKTGFYMLSTDAGQLIYHPDKNLKDKNVSESGMSKNIVSAIQNKTAGTTTYTAMNQTNYGYLSPVGNTGWTITTGLPEKEFNSSYDAVRTSVFSVFIIAFLLLIMLIIFVSKGMINPLKKLTAAAGKIADGDLDVDVNIKSKDETGQVAEAFSRTVNRLKQYIQYIDEVSAVLDQIAVGNLTFHLQCDYIGEFSKIKTSLENIKYTLVKTFSGIHESAEQVASGSDQVASASQALAQGATEQASSIEELSASITEIAGQVTLNAANAATASQLADQTSAEIQRGNTSMRKLIEAMDEMSQSSSQIGKIIKTIQDIAFQTNILALNAAVEAARAGTAGKGFAVVADEVRNLAGKSAEAAENTTILIENSINSVKNGTNIANETAQSLNLIIDSAQKTTDLVDQISKASKEQSFSINQVTTGVDQISAVVQTNSATSEESAASSEELNSQAQTLKMLVERFSAASSADD